MLLVTRLLVFAGSINSALSAPRSTQEVLSVDLKSQTSEESSFGVGFDLTASYGSAAVSFSNGSIVTITIIAAKEEYNEVFQRLSLESSKHLSPPYDNLGGSWDDMPRQYLRKARKSVGLPASSDVSILADMLSKLRASVEERVGPIVSAGVTTPHLVALYDEDIRDAFEYVGLENVAFPVGNPGHHLLWQTSAAYAGYGFGLCPSYKDPMACEDEQRKMPEITVMAVLYTRTALAVSLSIVWSAYSLWEPDYRYLIDTELGYDMKDRYEHEVYWANVKARLQEMMVENPGYDRPAKVLLMGDCVEDGDFQRQLFEALGEQMETLPEILGSHSDVVAARGVAELAKRVPFKSSEAQESYSLYSGSRSAIRDPVKKA